MPQLPMTVRRSQLRALREPVFDEYLHRLGAHVADVFPHLATLILSAKGRRFMHHCAERAGRLGIVDQHSVALFTDLCTALGPCFDREPRLHWILELLEATELGANARLFLIYTRLPERCPNPPLSAARLETEIDGLRLTDRDDLPTGHHATPFRPQVPQWRAGFWG